MITHLTAGARCWQQQQQQQQQQQLSPITMTHRTSCVTRHTSQLTWAQALQREVQLAHTKAPLQVSSLLLLLLLLLLLDFLASRVCGHVFCATCSNFRQASPP
jgi:hypothetical protein